ncbi:Homogentisate 1,2-dioxygenase [Thelonectria olida]|uniref:homogentisate 1,2-dioxygenase n=1 Tax=Thelonectria olida TaxID=1576542 RepID=A0A9P8VPE2_9HYPO|nr:Homogentisate 1,2-dioxygenase [Thelonectria olida]
MPSSEFKHSDPYQYKNGFQSYHETEAITGALPISQNSPQKPAYGLYAEKISGTAFTVPRADNQQTWVYRILPSASHEDYEEFGMHPPGNGANGATQANTAYTPQNSELQYLPNQLRFDPFDIEDADWVNGTRRVAGCGDPRTKTGFSINVFSATRDMPSKQAYYSADGDLLVVLQSGVLDAQTELGKLLIRPNEILVIPRGIWYRITLPNGPVRGYALELYQGHFKLPELGFMGSNALANARDFQVPVAFYEEDTTSEWTIVSKFNEKLHQLRQNHSAFDVVAWHGLYFPYKYDLGRFNVMGSISYDHPDPSIYTVLTAPSDSPGTAVCDLAIFAPRWLVQEDTFRPPFYHRNTMAEFASLIQGEYDAAKDGGVKPGSATIHNVMSGHGPDSETFEQAFNAELKPVKVGTSSMAFMFETLMMMGVTDWALNHSKKRQADYQKVKWQPLKVRFKAPASDAGVLA